MKPRIVKASSLSELQTYERCFISENYSSDAVSIARARVKPCEATVAHHLNGVDEIYLIASGKGVVNVDGLQPVEVVEGDVVVIPASASQKITNTGKTDLAFYCICTPKFTTDCYCDEEAQEKPP